MRKHNEPILTHSCAQTTLSRLCSASRTHTRTQASNYNISQIIFRCHIHWRNARGAFAARANAAAVAAEAEYERGAAGVGEDLFNLEDSFGEEDQHD